MTDAPFWRLTPMRPHGRGAAVPGVAGVAIPDGAAVEVLLGGSSVVGVLVVLPGDSPMLSVHYTDEDGGSTGQQTSLALPFGAFVRPVSPSRLPTARGDTSAAFPAPWEGPADPRAQEAADVSTKDGGAWVEAPGGAVPLARFLDGNPGGAP